MPRIITQISRCPHDVLHRRRGPPPGEPPLLTVTTSPPTDDEVRLATEVGRGIPPDRFLAAAAEFACDGACGRMALRGSKFCAVCEVIVRPDAEIRAAAARWIATAPGLRHSLLTDLRDDLADLEQFEREHPDADKLSQALGAAIELLQKHHLKLYPDPASGIRNTVR